MSTGFIRMHEQLRAVWKARDKDHPLVRGMLLTGAGNERKVLERWFTVVGHALFYCSSRESPEFSGVFFTDIFNPVVAKVNGRTLGAFDASDKEALSFALHLKGVAVSDLEVLLFPSSAEEKKQWLERLQGDAGLSVPTRQNSDKQRRGTDGREKVVVIEGSINDSLYMTPTEEPRAKSPRHWREEWKRIARLALTLPDAYEVSTRTKVLGKLVMSEGRYVHDLSTLVNMYYRVFKTAITSGHLVMPRDQLDVIFLNCESLLLFHRLLLDHMRRAFTKPSALFGELFHQFVPQMSLYLEFIKNHEKSLQMLEDCLLNPSLSTFLENHHFSHDCEAQQLKQLLYSPVTRLDIYWASLEELLKYTYRSHIDYKPLSLALETLKQLKQTLAQKTSQVEHQEKMLSILEGVGTQGFLLMQPNCSLVLEGSLHLPPSAKWMAGSLKRRPVHCYLYTNALVVMSSDKKVKNQVFPLCGASVYPYVKRTGEVTHAKDPELDVKALKVYSPNGPRNGIVLSFSTQSTKGLWVVRISEAIRGHSPEPESSRSISPQLPLRRYNSVLTITESSNAELAKPPLPPRPSSLQAPTGRRRSSTVTGVSKPDHSPASIPIFRTSSLLSLNEEPNDGTPPAVPPRSQFYSIPTLFSKLTNPPDPYYPSTFLLTYRMFTNAHEILDALIEAHRKDLDGRKSNGKSRDMLSTLSLRFFNTLKMWVNKYYVDFHHDVTLKRVLVVYLNNIKEHKHIHEKECVLAEAILKTVSQRGHIPLARKSKLKIHVRVPREVKPVSFDELSAETIATQLTWVEHEAYARIKPYEFLQQKWTKKNREELAPNICYVISRFNQMTLWITKEILGQDAAKHRCAAVQKMLQIADHCLRLKNYVTVFQITSALGSTPIQRLKKTWDSVPQTLMEQFTELRKLTSLEGGSKVYRERQKRSLSPSVPYIGPYLNQLICTEVGMPTFVKQPPEHINYSKLVKLGAVIDEVTRFQNPKYSLAADGTVLAFLDNALESAKGFDDEQRYSRSIEIEPRKESSKAKSSKVKSPTEGSRTPPRISRMARSKSPQPVRERSKSPQPSARLMSYRIFEV